MAIKKKTLSTFIGLGIAFIAIALIFAYVTHTGANRPPMRFLDIPEETTEYINNLASQLKNKTSLKISTQGPFNWDNDKDLGNRKTNGMWAKEEDALSVVYYKRDKDAVMQEKAYNYVNKLDKIAEDISNTLGKYNYPEDINGRKTAIYLPTTDMEYNEILQELCGEGATIPSNKEGCSAIEVGPLGCQLKGIVIHPNTLNSDDPDAIDRVLRKELARYNYYCSSNFDENISKQNWFTEGLFEYFANGDKQLDTTFYNNDFISQIITTCDLSTDFPLKGNMSSEVGQSFFAYFVEVHGSQALTELISNSYELDAESLFSSMGIDLNKEKDSWYLNLCEDLIGETDEATESLFDSIASLIEDGVELVDEVMTAVDESPVLSLLVTALLL